MVLNVSKIYSCCTIKQWIVFMNIYLRIFSWKLTSWRSAFSKKAISFLVTQKILQLLLIWNLISVFTIYSNCSHSQTRWIWFAHTISVWYPFYFYSSIYMWVLQVVFFLSGFSTKDIVHMLHPSSPLPSLNWSSWWWMLRNTN